MSPEQSGRNDTLNGSISPGALRNHQWPRFLHAPDSQLVNQLYEPSLKEAIGYDRCCAYFTSSVLSAASRGFAGLIQRLILMGDDAPRPAIRLIVNEELSPEDVKALMETGDTSQLEKQLLNRFVPPTDLLEKQRFQMLAWLVQKKYLDVRVGIMRRGNGILHAKYGLVYDQAGDVLVFAGSGNESAQGLRGNYEQLEITPSWSDPDRFNHFANQFINLWNDNDDTVKIYPLPEAVEKELIRYVPAEPPVIEPKEDLNRQKSAMIWHFIAEAPFFFDNGATCDALAPLKELWPHQRQVIEEVTSAWPDGRLLCDEVGMGKTIEAVMILRRLLAGHGVKRALLLLPAALTIQWQEELREKGGLLVPRLINSDTLIWPDGQKESTGNLSRALEQDLLIMSRETARLESNRSILLDANPWDIILLDEAHAARRATRVEGEFNSATLLLELLRQLQIKQKARSFLLLSATPMQIAPFEPWDLLSILGEGGAWLSDFDGIRAYYEVLNALKKNKRPDEINAKKAAWLISSDTRFTSPPSESQKISSADTGERFLRFIPQKDREKTAHWMRKESPLYRRMHRNTRETLNEYYRRGMIANKPPVRQVFDFSYDFQISEGPERKVYNAVGEYIERRFEELEGEKPGKGFVMTIYRRRVASSPQALKRSLERRLEGLRKVMNNRAISGYIDLVDAPEAIIDDDLPEGMDSYGISASFPSDPEIAKKEANEVEYLLNQLKNLAGIDTKRDSFFDILYRVKEEGRSVLVFTEYTDTMDYLLNLLVEHYGSLVAGYSGDGGRIYINGEWQSRTKKYITDQLAAGKIKYLICTDAASEGLNLQTASALINYDLPWNPSKVEQRIGRIDRIGQISSEIKVYNLFLLNSIDEKVYKALDERCGLFKHFVGSMQPVLAQARTMLNNPNKFSIEELEHLANEYEHDILNTETYVSSEIKSIEKKDPAVTKTDILDAINLIKHEFSIKFEKNNVIQVIFSDHQKITFSLDSDSLDENPSILPFTFNDSVASRISQNLSRSDEKLPLVISSYRDAAFRISVPIWIGNDTIEIVTSISELNYRLGSWNGNLPDKQLFITATKYAEEQARNIVKSMKLQQKSYLLVNGITQKGAVRIRTLRELGRLLKCLNPDSADLKMVLKGQIERGGSLGQRLNEALQRLENKFDIDGYLNWEINEFYQTLRPNQIQSRLTGSSLIAALNDYRWKMKEFLG